MSKLKVVVPLLLLAALGLGAGGLSRPAPAARAEPAGQPQPEKQEAPREKDEVRRALDELEAARAELVKVNKAVAAARERFLAARERYETAKRQGRPAARTALTGVLVRAELDNGSVRVEFQRESKEPDNELLGYPWSAVISRAYESFPVAKDASISRDNVKARLADLKKGARLTLGFDPDGKTVAKIIADGGTVEGPIRYVSANGARNTITVTAGKKAEKKVYHLVEETEVKAAGKAARVQDLQTGATLLLTLSVEDANTVIRIETVPPGKEEGE
jgi:hypothetical protein